MQFSIASSQRLRNCVLSLLFIACVVRAQQPPEVLQSQETLKAKTRLVIVDVVATDTHGQPVTDLTADDFTMLEQGQPQKISHFSFQHLGTAPAIAPRSLPPNVVTNAPQFTANSLNVILFDGINGDFTSQAYARDQLVKFFAGAELDRPVAIFALETRLRLLHDFTTDGGLLKAAVEKYKPPTLASTTESTDSRASAFTTYGDYHTNDQTIQTTLNQLNALAKILAGYPGRKNLIWLSESFPLDLFPDKVISAGNNALASAPGSGPAAGYGAQSKQALGDPGALGEMVAGGAFKDYAAQLMKLADSMMAAQVAVYPVDAAGVGRNDHLASQHTANNMADRTGGKAFHNSNDLATSMRASIDDGSTYYTLEYYPDNKKWDGQFRVIQVKTSRPGVTLRYRLGYYAVDPEKLAREEPDKVSENLSRALELDTPAYTAVKFQAGIVPPSPTAHNVLVNFAIDPHSVSFERTEDGMEHARVSCTVWAYAHGKDKPVMSNGETTKADLKPEVYQQMLKTYFPCKRELELKPGTYILRLAVIDRSTNMMGTANAEVTVP